MGKRLSVFAVALILISINTHQANAQQDVRLKIADGSYSKGDFYKAIPLYRDIVKHNPKNVKAWYKLSEALYHVRNHSEAVEAFAILHKLTEADKRLKNEYYTAFFHYGNSLMAMQEYEKAKHIYLQFLRLKPGHVDYRSMKRQANAKIRACKEAEKLLNLAYLDEYEIERLPNTVNGKYSDFGPVWLDSQTLLFTSLRSDSALEISDNEEFSPINRLHIAKKSNGEWQEAELAENFNHDFFHSANGSLSADGKLFAFSICKENKAHEIRCAIYQSKKVNGQWQAPVKLGNHINKSTSTSSQPAYGQVKRRGNVTEVLYFVSDREKGRGGMDIWYSAKDRKGDWSKPVNCGSAINTSGNEITPFYDDASGTLYFSSDFHQGLGGYDIFSAYGGLKSWRSPINMGASINTGFDDTYFSWRVADANGTLVSNRDGSLSVFGKNCCDDIFYVEKHPVFQLPGIVISTDSLPLPDATVGVKLMSAGENPDSLFWLTASNEKGSFELPYRKDLKLALVVAKTGFETTEMDLQDQYGNYPDTVVVVMKPLTEEKEALDKMMAQKLEVLSEQRLEGKITAGTVLVMEHIYFEFDKAAIQPEAHQDLDLLFDYLRNNPKVKIEIAGHTDGKGDAVHNQELSQRRADAIRNYLIDKGIHKRRLTAIGYGEEKPIAPNENPDGSDNPEGRRKNRRTEVIIL